jgi:phosphohistidine phosphatase
MIIYFLRHASAGQPKSNPAKDDKRALDDDGITQCRLIGSALAALDVSVDLVLSSPLKRSTQTASLVSTEFGYEGKVQVEKSLAPGASFADFRQMVQKHSQHEAILVVGHNPSLSEFLSLTLTGRHESSVVDLKKCAVARVDARQRSATLDWLLTPKIARTLYEVSAANHHPKHPRK